MSEETQDGRLLSLEETMRNLAASSERVVVSQQVLAEKVDKGFDDMVKAHTTFAETQAKFDARLQPFEIKAAAAQKRIDLAKKLALPGIAAMAGVFGAKFGNEIVKFVGGLFGN
jgi:hypothetical protein